MTVHVPWMRGQGITGEQDNVAGRGCINEDELADFVWSDRERLTAYVPYGFYTTVQQYLDDTL